MSKEVTILDNQCFIDIAMQELGDVERVFEPAILKGMSITDSLTPGDTVTVGDYELDKVNDIKVFLDDAKKPASSYNDEESDTLPPGGIGYMQIGRNFIAS